MEVEAFLLGEGAADAPRMKLLRISMYKGTCMAAVYTYSSDLSKTVIEIWRTRALVVLLNSTTVRNY